jgi:hypothetical protein
MNFKSALPVAFASIIAAFAATPVIAAAKRAVPRPTKAVDGTAAIHSISVEGNRVCFADHWHYGNSSGLATKRQAEIEAIKSWSGFVAFEYGDDWANFAKSGSKSMKCSAPYHGAWSCDLSARPCK